MSERIFFSLEGRLAVAACRDVLRHLEVDVLAFVLDVFVEVVWSVLASNGRHDSVAFV
ncbi:hypothetical protein [Haloferax mucosum]|uniref:hypothetical protein n=1 Tax=Haloferax mucosum TaxID=403181 RepID=UPI001F4C62E3|nr:hypothetical protein [Haloferax mucosum]